MPTLHNPAENSLFCHRLGRILAINERVEITDDEAADLAGGPIFVVEDYDAPANEDLDSLTRDELNERAAELGVEDPDKLANKGDVIDAIGGTPERTTAKRGSKRAEVNKAPDTEKRG